MADLPLRGAGGEPIDFARTIVSHGVAEFPPQWHRRGAARAFAVAVPPITETFAFDQADVQLASLEDPPLGELIARAS